MADARLQRVYTTLTNEEWNSVKEEDVEAWLNEVPTLEVDGVTGAKTRMQMRIEALVKDNYHHGVRTLASLHTTESSAEVMQKFADLAVALSLEPRGNGINGVPVASSVKITNRTGSYDIVRNATVGELRKAAIEEECHKRREALR